MFIQVKWSRYIACLSILTSICLFSYGHKTQIVAHLCALFLCFFSLMLFIFSFVYLYFVLSSPEVCSASFNNTWKKYLFYKLFKDLIYVQNSGCHWNQKEKLWMISYHLMKMFELMCVIVTDFLLLFCSQRYTQWGHTLKLSQTDW